MVSVGDSPEAESWYWPTWIEIGSVSPWSAVAIHGLGDAIDSELGHGSIPLVFPVQQQAQEMQAKPGGDVPGEGGGKLIAERSLRGGWSGTHRESRTWRAAR